MDFFNIQIIWHITNVIHIKNFNWIDNVRPLACLSTVQQRKEVNPYVPNNQRNPRKQAKLDTKYNYIIEWYNLILIVSRHLIGKNK